MICSLLTDGRTDTKVNTDDTLSGFQDIFLQPIIKDRPNKNTEAYDGKWYKEAVIITRNTKYVATRSGNNRM